MDSFPDREAIVAAAKSLAQGKYYEDAMFMIKHVASMKVPLSREEWDLMQSVFNKVIHSLRASWKTLLSVEDILKKNSKPVENLKNYTEKIGKEIDIFCTEIMHVLNEHVLPFCATLEDKLLCTTMLGDCLKYRSELAHEDTREALADHSNLESSLAPFNSETSFVAKALAEAECYDDAMHMIKFIASMSENIVVLSPEERDLIILTFKKVIASRQAVWRTLVSYQAVDRIKAYAEKTREEINRFCGEIACILSDHILPSFPPEADKVLYYTMLGDCCRYRAELTDGGDSRRKLADQAIKAYKEGTTIADNYLEGGDLARLELALSHAEFYCEIEDNVEMAIMIADTALKGNQKARESLPETMDVVLRLSLNLEMKWKKAEPREDRKFEQYEFATDEDF